MQFCAWGLNLRRVVACDCLNSRDDCRIQLCQRPGLKALADIAPFGRASFSSFGSLPCLINAAFAPEDLIFGIASCRQSPVGIPHPRPAGRAIFFEAPQEARREWDQQRASGSKG